MTLPTFEEFYTDVYGYGPFPWQRRLVDEVLANGWERLVLDLPTGAGKTSALDVALYCLAAKPEQMPRRTVLVVDRRIVVDQAAEHARELSKRLIAAEAGPAKKVADVLRALTSKEHVGPPFRVAMMRGGMPRDNDWARWPHQPLLGMSTVDQLGSRLLFRGYGVSPMSASIHAGLIGNDTLILLDEVHLSVPFEETLGAIQRSFRKRRGSRAPVHHLPTRFHVVPMSATIRTEEAGVRRFTLNAEDRTHPGLEPRLVSHKLATLVPVKVSGDDEGKKREALARRAVEQALELQRAGARVVGLVVNRVDTARLAYALLADDHAGTTEALLMTGRMRPLERDHIVRERLMPRTKPGRDRSGDRPFIVVATQCIEAGADLDLDALVTECASLDALRQRFGRVDRRGDLVQSRSVILGRSDMSAADPVYGAALSTTWTWLEEQASDDVVDFGISWLPPALDTTGRPLTTVLADAAHAPVLLPAHLDAWVQTSRPITPDPAVGMWLHGPEKPAADVQIVWRSLDAYGDQLAEVIDDLLESVRPSTLESVTIPIGAARRWLAGEEATGIADVMAGDEVIDEKPRRSSRKVAESVAWRWAGDRASPIAASDLRPGDVVIVDITRGGLREGSFDPDSDAPVQDLGDLAQLRARGVATLRLEPATLRMWGIGSGDAPSRDSAEMETETDFRDRICDWIAAWPESAAAGASEIVTTQDRENLRAAAKRMRLTEVGRAYVATASIPTKSTDDEFDAYEAITESADSSFQSDEVTLRQHSKDVRSFVGEFARNLGLSTALCEDLERAAWLHDIGKADPRFQSWLVGGDDLRASVLTEPLAKSSLDPGNAMRRREARKRAKYPDGYRHELLSLGMIAASAEALHGAHDPELVKHLVASHHGWCRPFAAPVDDPVDLPVLLEHGGAQFASTTRHALARLDSGVIDRFWNLTEQYGWWGLAWLEAILRLADHRASQNAEHAKGTS